MMRLVSAWMLVNGLLLAPAWLAARVSDAPAPGWIALESALLVGILALLPRRPWSRALAWVLAAGTVLVTFVALADLVFQVSLARPLNLFLDLYLLQSVHDLAVGNAGPLRTALIFAGALLVLGGLTFGLAWLLSPPESKADRPLPRLAPKLAGVVLVGVFALGLTGERAPAVGQHLATPVFQLVGQQARLFRDTRRERRAFASELAAPGSYAAVPGLLEGLQGTNVVVAFIESYGMAALDDPEFAQVVRPRLDSLAARAAEAGLQVASGRLDSPTTGGQSWYAHGTLMSGLWLENQLRYDLLLASDRETLVDDFRRAGHRTVALMPAITKSWPEGVRLGYDDVYTLPTIPYAGPPIYWVSVPDQFTWSFLARLLQRSGDRPLFIEAAMVSSHAPWTPILPLLDWDSIGDGRAFEPFRQEGHPPEELWVDTQELRRGYARSLDYSLQATAGFAERYLDGHTLLIVLGDHQAAPWVTGAAGADVPVHVLARDSALLEPFLAWGFTPGAIPESSRNAPGMDLFRDWFVRAFSGTRRAAGSTSAKGGS